MSADSEAPARELARGAWDALNRFECRGPCQGDTGCKHLGFCLYEVCIIETNLTAALDAAETRGRIAGLKEAQEVVENCHFRAARTYIVAVIDARLAPLSQNTPDETSPIFHHPA